MIARTWHGAVRVDDADVYHAYLLQTGVAGCRGTPGNLGVQVFRRIEGDTAHFLFISSWESLAAIKAFAGDDIDRARYYTEDRKYLLELEPHVTHYQVLEAPQALAGGPPGRLD